LTIIKVLSPDNRALHFLPCPLNITGKAEIHAPVEECQLPFTRFLVTFFPGNYGISGR